MAFLLPIYANISLLTKRSCPTDYDMFKRTCPIPAYLVDKFYNIYYKRIRLGDNTYKTKEISDIVKRMTKYCKNNRLAIEEPKNITELSIDNIELIKKFIKHNEPFVIRNANINLIQTDEFISKFSNNNVLFVNDKKEYYDKLGTIYKTKDYVANCETIFFNKNAKKIIPNIPIKIKTVIESMLKLIGSNQLFLSIKNGNGTPLHSAFVDNFFYQIDGKKKWTFVHPNNTHMIYPVISESCVYSASYTQKKKYEC